MSEYLDICTEDGMPTGRTVERKTAHSEDICHRTAIPLNTDNKAFERGANGNRYIADSKYNKRRTHSPHTVVDTGG